MNSGKSRATKIKSTAEVAKKLFKYLIIPWLIWFGIIVVVVFLLKKYCIEFYSEYEIIMAFVAALVFIFIYQLSFIFSGALKKGISLYIFYRVVFGLSILLTVVIIYLLIWIQRNMY